MNYNLTFCVNYFDKQIASKIKKIFNHFVCLCSILEDNALKFDFVVRSVRQFVNEKRCLIDALFSSDSIFRINMR